MLRHIVMWALKDPADAEVFAAELRSCSGLVPGMREFDVGIRSDGLEANCDVVLVSSFDDAGALDAYLQHGHHKLVVGGLAAYRKERHVLDFISVCPVPDEDDARKATTAPHQGDWE